MKEDRKAYEFFLKDDLLRSSAERNGVPRFNIYGKKGMLFTLLEAVVSQQLSDRAAKAIFLRLEEYVEKKVRDVILLADAEREELKKIGISGSKAGTIIEICRLVREKELELDSFPEMGDEEVKNELIRIKGIGEWTAQMFLIFGLKRKDVWPSSDLGIRKGLTALLDKNELLSPEKVERIGKRWSPYRSYAAYYIWRS